MAEQSAKELRDIMSQSEGDGVDAALYKYATQPAASNARFIQNESWQNVLSAFHAAKVDDQFVPPIVAVDADRKPLSIVKEGDYLVYFDFRTDRAKPVCLALCMLCFNGQSWNFLFCFLTADTDHCRFPRHTVRWPSRRIVG